MSRRHVDVPVTYSADATDLATSLGADPYAGPVALGHCFAAGVHSPAPANRDDHELVAAQAFADEGADVRLTLEDHARPGEQSIDAWVRWAPEDHGVATELKSLVNAQNLSKATKGHIIKGAQQLANHAGTQGGLANGHLLIDGRQRGLTDADAVRAWTRTVGQANQFQQVLPAKVIVLLSDGCIRAFTPTVSSNADGSTRYEPFGGQPTGPLSRDDLDWTMMWRNRWQH